MRNDGGNVMVDETFKFSLNIIRCREGLKQTKKFPGADGIFHSVTSTGANVREAQDAENKRDFFRKIKISAKEADEAEYLPTLCFQSEFYPSPGTLVNEDFREIQLILSKTIASAKKSALH